MTAYTPDALIAADIHAYLDTHQTKSMLRFITCGSVDDGKSTLIGRLLWDTSPLYDDQREKLLKALNQPGDIAAAVGLKDTFTGDTLTDPDHPVILESMTFPEPVIEVKIEPKTKADQDKLAIALQRLAEEDPTFRVKTDPETAETLIAGMGELHLDVLVDRMVREFKVAANVGRPSVSYRETIRKAAEGNGRFVRQTGGKGQYGHAVIKLEPGEKGSGYEFVDKIVGGAVPKEYIPGVEKGLESVLGSGVLAGFPVVDLKVSLIDGAYHEVDSNVLTFEIASRAAFRELKEQGDPRLLESPLREETLGGVQQLLTPVPALLGELSLDGLLRPVRGALSIASKASRYPMWLRFSFTACSANYGSTATWSCAHFRSSSRTWCDNSTSRLIYTSLDGFFHILW